MTNGEIISRTPPRGSEGAPDGSGSETPSEASPTESGATPETPPETPYEYTHPMLKGRTPEEVERIFRLTEQTVREQGGRLTKVESELNRSRSETEPSTPPPASVSAQDFFADPVKHIQDELARQVGPLREEIATAKKELTAPSVRDKLRAEFGDWTQVEPYVDYLISQGSFPDPSDEGLLRMLYLTGKGLMVQQGITVESGLPSTPAPAAPTAVAPSAPAAPPSGSPVVVPPQHPASTPPAPPPAPEPTAQTRELTEAEKRLAREHKLTPEEFIRWQEMDMEEVAVADFDLPEEKTNGQ